LCCIGRWTQTQPSPVVTEYWHSLVVMSWEVRWRTGTAQQIGYLLMLHKRIWWWSWCECCLWPCCKVYWMLPFFCVCVCARIVIPTHAIRSLYRQWFSLVKADSLNVERTCFAPLFAFVVLLYSAYVALYVTLWCVGTMVFAPLLVKKDCDFPLIFF
jgi:hypothetical protein